MANYHREVYQPSFEDGPAYDTQDDDLDGARARLPLLIVIALLVLAAFAGVVWLAYNQGVKQGQIGLPTVIAAPEGPARAAPETQVASVPYTGLKVYGDPVSPDQEAEASVLAPAAPPVEFAEPEPVPESAPSTPVVATVPAPVVAAPPAAPAPSLAAAVGPVLQIGSFPSEALALDAWNAFRTRHAGVVGNLSQNIQVADLGERGTWYRLRVGPFTDKGAANQACEQLKAAGATCLVAAP